VVAGRRDDVAGLPSGSEPLTIPDVSGNLMPRVRDGSPFPSAASAEFPQGTGVHDSESEGRKTRWLGQG